MLAKPSHILVDAEVDNPENKVETKKRQKQSGKEQTTQEKYVKRCRKKVKIVLETPTKKTTVC